MMDLITPRPLLLPQNIDECYLITYIYVIFNNCAIRYEIIDIFTCFPIRITLLTPLRTLTTSFALLMNCIELDVTIKLIPTDITDEDTGKSKYYTGNTLYLMKILVQRKN